MIRRFNGILLYGRKASLIRRPPKISYYLVTESFRRAVRNLSQSQLQGLVVT